MKDFEIISLDEGLDASVGALQFSNKVAIFEQDNHLFYIFGGDFIAIPGRSNIYGTYLDNQEKDIWIISRRIDKLFNELNKQGQVDEDE